MLWNKTRTDVPCLIKDVLSKMIDVARSRYNASIHVKRRYKKLLNWKVKVLFLIFFKFLHLYTYLSQVHQNFTEIFWFACSILFQIRSMSLKPVIHCIKANMIGTNLIHRDQYMYIPHQAEACWLQCSMYICLKFIHKT